MLARADAMEALVNGYDSSSNALRDIHNSFGHNTETRHETWLFKNTMDLLETVLMAKICNILLLRFNNKNKVFQSTDVHLKKRWLIIRIPLKSF